MCVTILIITNNLHDLLSKKYGYSKISVVFMLDTDTAP